MTNLSPAAQAVMDAFSNEPTFNTDGSLNVSGAIAAALRAAADQVEDLEVPWSYMGDSFLVYEHGQTSAAEHLRAIAAELEALPDE